jgi:hypothetical protein
VTWACVGSCSGLLDTLRAAWLLLQVLIEDYLVWKAQWERTHGVEYGWRPTKVRSVVQPSQAIGAEGRYAVV